MSTYKICSDAIFDSVYYKLKQMDPSASELHQLPIAHKRVLVIFDICKGCYLLRNVINCFSKYRNCKLTRFDFKTKSHKTSIKFHAAIFDRTEIF